jgi:hypothetical protein
MNARLQMIPQLQTEPIQPQANIPRWNLALRIAFRFWLVYLGLYLGSYFLWSTEPVGSTLQRKTTSSSLIEYSSHLSDHTRRGFWAALTAELSGSNTPESDSTLYRLPQNFPDAGFWPGLPRKVLKGARPRALAHTCCPVRLLVTSSPDRRTEPAFRFVVAAAL